MLGKDMITKKGVMTVLALIAFGSIWGLLECVLGSIELSGIMSEFPMGALLEGLVGLGLMAWTRKTFKTPGMALGMGIIAAALRFWSPVGTCVVCSSLAIAFESLVFEFIFYSKHFSLYPAKDRKPLGLAQLIPLGVVAGYSIYVAGYMFTQLATPLFTEGVIVLSDFLNVLPLIFGRGFFAAVFGGIALPVAVAVKAPAKDIFKVSEKPYYATMIVISVVCWIVVISLSRYGFFN